jgi:hypothetical protein
MSVGTLLSVLKSKVLWASDIRFLNDGAEFQHGLEVVLNEVEASFGGVDDRRRPLLERLPWALQQAATKPVYATSFSAQGDLLSQWRAYCPPARGVALGLDAEALAAATAHTSFRLAICVYDAELQRQLVRDILDQAIKQDIETDVETDSHVLARDLIELAVCLKHPSFVEEQEWRIVSTPWATGEFDLPLRFREGRSSLVPYVEFPIFGAEVPPEYGHLKDLLAEDAPRRVLTAVVIGPTPFPDLSREAVTSLLDGHGLLEGVEVALSETPFRTW